MNYHGGILDDGYSARLKRNAMQDWPTLPPEQYRDLLICCATPGFSAGFWADAFGVTTRTIYTYRYLGWKLYPKEAADNFASVTRDDSLRLAAFSGWTPIPTLIHMQADLQNGMKRREAKKLYRVSDYVIQKTLKKPLLSARTMPAWYRAMIPGA